MSVGYQDGSLVPYGSFGRWGADVETEKSADYYLNLVSQYAPVAQAVITQVSDPQKQAKLLEAKLKWQIARGASSSKIAETRAKLEAARHSAALAAEGETSTREWRKLGKIAILMGIGVGASVILLLLSRVMR